MRAGSGLRTTFYGIGLFVFSIFVYIILPFIIRDQIIRMFIFAVFAILKLALIFHGQGIIKKLNRNYVFWAGMLYFFTSITLILLGSFSKLKKELITVKLEPSKRPSNVNKLPDLTLSRDSNMLIDCIKNDTFTLKYMIKNYREFVKDNSSLFPIFAAYELNGRGVILDPETIISLEQFAKEKGYVSFSFLLEKIGLMTPEQIAESFE